MQGFICRSYLAELLLDKGYFVHGISRTVTSGSHIQHLQAALAVGQLPQLPAGAATRDLNPTFLYTPVLLVQFA